MDTTRLNHLLQRHLDAELTLEERDELQTLLLSMPEARREYWRQARTHAALCLLGEQSWGRPDSIPRRRPVRWEVRHVAWATAAAVVFSAVLLWQLRDREERFAELVETHQARWESSTLPTEPGSRLGAGRLRLAEGLARLRFARGAELTLEGPTELELSGPQLCRLHRGSLVAHVPEPARGFSVLEPPPTPRAQRDRHTTLDRAPKSPDLPTSTPPVALPPLRSPLPALPAMRTARLLGTGRSFYHVMSRVVDRRRVFEAKDKEIFRRILRNQEAFSGVRIVTYCLMSNHFHLLLEVPDRETLAPLDEEGLLAVLPRLYPGDVVEGVKQEFERARAAGDERWHREILARFERRRGDLGLFLKEVKLRITFYMNKRLGRTGTLWEGRYKSVLVEDNEQALLTIAAYIDLNPIRAGLVSRPEDYRWCGYGEAVGGGKRAQRAREGLGLMLAESLQDPDFRQDWRRTAARYRVFLYLDGQEINGGPEPGERGRRGMKAEVVEAVVGQGGAMPLREVLRRRVRYFCDGAVLGTAEFVDAVFEREQALQKRFGEKRTSGARRMRGAEWGELRVLRDLQKDVIGT